MGYLEEAAEKIERARTRAADGLEQLAKESVSPDRLRAVSLPAGTVVLDPVTGQRGIVEHSSFAHIFTPPADR